MSLKLRKQKWFWTILQKKPTCLEPLFKRVLVKTPAMTKHNYMPMLKMKSFPKFNVFEWHCVIWQGYLGVSWLFDQPCADLRAIFLLVLDRIIAETTSEWWMMHLYSALLCIVVQPKRFTIMCVCVWGGGGCLSSTTTSVQHPLGK